MWKPSRIALSLALVLCTATQAKAQDFEEFLQGILTPEEIQVHQQVGSKKAMQLARETCTALNAGDSVTEFATEVAQAIASEGLPQEQLEVRALYSGKIIAVGVAMFCPEHLMQLQELQP
ncbi:DUF732 domain-containing protein [Phormidium sp. CCY1219]|uniref:DUF732 domain-containing protein n=1 Tax=Phormidium sp. CCY1219 TaxID=2886104 RepID=UPI002D1F8780|nr:DUF732 domain-containing protein [Phormidium sp. CCY1219]MEB3831557.1 DUF732 domain-containing protein [Phormidium sp. CCY1219]